MKLGMDHIGNVTDEKLHFLQQLGVEGVMANPVRYFRGRGYFSVEELQTLKDWIESYDMKLMVVGPFQEGWTWAYKWMLGLPGKDEQIENAQKLVRNMGQVGIPLLTFNMHAMRFYRTSRANPRRGGALGTNFEIEKAKDQPLMYSETLDTSLIPESHRKPISDDEMWANLTYFLKAVIPVAEEAGVKLGIHPDDPPIPQTGGVARIMRSPDAFRRAIEIVPSDNIGLLFCQGCFTEMGADVFEEIRYFGSRKKIFWVHFRNVVGTVENFGETFPDNGRIDMLEAMKVYDEIGYDSYLVPDHKLIMVGDTDWGHRYWGFALGYMRGLMQAVKGMK